jgi:hypothetical protein
LNPSTQPLEIRPYQLLCLICAQGETGTNAMDPALAAILAAIRARPDAPVTLRCNAGDVFAYQDPGTAQDSPEGEEFNRKRDLDILQRMSWPPGITLPARVALMCLLKRITSVSGICGYDTVTAPAWRGCAKAGSGNYERGQERGIGALIPPRDEAEMAREKEASIKALNAATEVTIRPHILLCAVCQYGGGTRPPFKPDNLPEFLQMVLAEKPDIVVRMARQADWLMCAPCPRRVPELNACVNVLGAGGLSNEKRDLDTLQKLGLQFGSAMKARDLFRLIFERIPTTQNICKREGNACPCVWWDSCGERNVTRGDANYEKGRDMLLSPPFGAALTD